MSCCYSSEPEEEGLCAGCGCEIGNGTCGRDDGWSDREENEFYRKENVTEELTEMLKSLVRSAKEYSEKHPPERKCDWYGFYGSIEYAEVAIGILENRTITPTPPKDPFHVITITI